MNAYIYDAVRTPRGKGKKGALHEVKPVDLLVTCLQALQQRNNLDTAEVEDVIVGCVTPIGDQGGDIAKTAALYAGWSDKVAGLQINRFCASGLEAVNLAAMKVASGMEEWIVAGGVESMSRIRMGSDGGALFLDPMVATKIGFVPQGIGADLIATIEGFSRTACDIYAAESQKRAAFAQENGYFDASIIPVRDKNGLLILEKDEYLRPQTTVDSLAKLEASFAKTGQFGFDHVAMLKYPQVESVKHVHHAGNSSGIVDGAALLL
ncbi:MAG: putative acyl-CoA thiolase, partial [Bacteroidota bacterium]